MKAKKNVKRLGMEDGRIAYEVTVRKDHFAEDYAEIVRIQERSVGKHRFYIHYEGFSKEEFEKTMRLVLINNAFRNAFFRKEHYVNYSSITL